MPGVYFDQKLNRGYGGLAGVPTKAGTFVATVTVEKVIQKSSGKKLIGVTVDSRDAICIVVVQPLPDWIAGTFHGWMTEPLPGYVGDDTTGGFVAGSSLAKVTIGSTGKVSVNIGGMKYTADRLIPAVMR